MRVACQVLAIHVLHVQSMTRVQNAHSLTYIQNARIQTHAQDT